MLVYRTCQDHSAEAPIKVFADTRSGNCDKVRFTLEYLEIPYEGIEVDSVAGATRTPGFVEVNPQGQVPTISVSGRITSLN